MECQASAWRTRRRLRGNAAPIVSGSRWPFKCAVLTLSSLELQPHIQRATNHERAGALKLFAFREVVLVARGDLEERCPSLAADIRATHEIARTLGWRVFSWS